MNGKGSRSRISDYKAWSDGWDAVFGDKSKDKVTLETGTTSGASDIVSPVNKPRIARRAKGRNVKRPSD